MGEHTTFIATGRSFGPLHDDRSAQGTPSFSFPYAPRMGWLASRCVSACCPTQPFSRSCSTGERKFRTATVFGARHFRGGGIGVVVSAQRGTYFFRRWATSLRTAASPLSPFMHVVLRSRRLRCITIRVFLVDWTTRGVR